MHAHIVLNKAAKLPFSQTTCYFSLCACICRDITPYEEAKEAMMKRKLSGKNVKEIEVAIQDCEEDLLKVCETN
jgi:hypothetical protein